MPGLVILTLAVYAQVASHSFLNFDDDQIVAWKAAALQWTPLTFLKVAEQMLAR